MRLLPSFIALSPMLVILSSCVGPGSTTRPHVPAPAPTRPGPAPVPAPAPVDWRNRPATPGDWSYRTDAAGSTAGFGPSTAAPMLTLRCDRAARRISLARIGATQPGAITIRTDYGAQSLAATVVSTPAPQLVATRAAADRLLDQIAYSRGKFAVEAPGVPTLIAPSWAEVSRVVEDCR